MPLPSGIAQGLFGAKLPEYNTPGIGDGAFPMGQQQAMQAPFQWGQGGRRLTPEQIAAERAIAQSLMGSDYSPVQHWSQGLGRVADNVLGAFRDKDALKAQDENQRYSAEQLKALTNPSGLPSAMGGPGVSSPAPGPNIAAMLADPYLDPNVKAVAQRQLDMQTFEQKEKLKAQYAEPTPEERLAQVAFPNDPARQLQFLQGVAANKEDPFVSVIGNDTFGSYAGRQSGLSAILGAQGQPAAGAALPAPGTVVADPRKQGGQSATPTGNF